MANSREPRQRHNREKTPYLFRRMVRSDIAVLFVAGLLSASGATAQALATQGAEKTPGGFRITPKISVRETYSDNVALAPRGQEKSDFITEIIPGIVITDRTARTTLKIDYSLDNFLYADDKNRNTATHQLSGKADIALVEDLLFVESNARISQQATSLLGPLGADSATSNRNNQTLRFFGIGPHLRKTLGREAVIDARYTLSQFSSGDSSAASNSQGRRFAASANSGSAFRDWGWGIDFVDDRIDFKKSQDTTLDSLTGSLHYRVSPRLSVIGTAGYERNDYFTLGHKPEGAIWNLGFDWRPSQRTSFSASAGRRFFGNTYSLIFRNVTRKTVWDLSYSRSLNTSRSSFGSGGGTLRAALENQILRLNPNISPADLEDAVVRAAQGRDLDAISENSFQTNTVFLETRLQGSVSLALRKMNMVFTLFNSVRDSDTTGNANIFTSSGDFALSRVIKQMGAGARWSYQLSPRNQASLSLDLSRNKFVDINRQDDLARLQTGITRKLSRTATGTINYRHVRRDSNFNSGEYNENALIGSLSATF